MARGNGEGSVTQRANGTWQGYVHLGRDSKGKVKRKYFYGKTKSEVLKKIRDLQAQIAADEYVEASKRTVGEWLDEWFKLYYIESQTSTREWAKSLIETHIKPAFGTRKIEHVKIEDVQRFIVEKWQAEGKSPRTVEAVRGIFLTAMDKAVELEYVKRNPVRGTTKPKGKSKNSYTILSQSQVNRLVSVASQDDYPLGALFVTAVLTGMRQGELFGLMWDCIDLDNRIIRVWRAVEFTKEHGPLLKDEPKRRASEREVVICDTVAQVLESHLERSRYSHGSRTLVFQNQNGGLLHKDNFRNRNWKRMKTDAKLPVVMNFHDLRHTHATHLLMRNIPIKIVAERLGHSDPAYTIKRYQHYIPSLQKGIMEQLNGLTS